LSISAAASAAYVSRNTKPVTFKLTIASPMRLAEKALHPFLSKISNSFAVLAIERNHGLVNIALIGAMTGRSEFATRVIGQIPNSINMSHCDRFVAWILLGPAKKLMNSICSQNRHEDKSSLFLNSSKQFCESMDWASK
jgi:hypothetical protein